MPSEVNVANYIESGAPASGPITWASSLGLGAPTFTTSSAGERLRLRNTLSGSAANYAVGVESNFMWFGVATGSSALGYKWYGGTSELMRLTGAPALGINTSPSEMLHLFGSAGTARMLYVQNSSNFMLKAGIDASNNGFIGSTNDTSLLLRTNNVTRVWIHETSGNVGVGTTSAPTANLQVYGASGALTRVLVDNDATYGVAFGVDASNIGFYGSTNATPVSIKTNNSDRVYVNTSGLVGVGSTSPLCKFHVIVGTSYAGGAPSTAGFALTDTSVDGTARALKFGLNAAGGYSIIQSTLEGTDHVGLVLNGALSVTTANVMIGATSGLAGSALDVNGLVRNRGGVVDSGVTRRTSGASYTMLTGDRVVVFASGSSGVFNLIASPETGRVVDARNDSGGDITLTPAAGNINGAGTLALPTGTGWTLRYDGTQWITFG